MQVGGSKGYKAEINVTPLVDVVLVLLIIFMVVTPMMQSGMAVELPEAQHVTEKSVEREQILVTVNADGQIFRDDDAMSLEALGKAIKNRISYNPGLEVFVKGDRSLDYSVVRGVLLACRDAGAKSVVLATKERKVAKKAE